MKSRAETVSPHYSFPSCNIYFMFALVHSDAKKISTLTIQRQKSGEALANSFNTFPCVVNSSFHIFPRSSSLCFGSEWTCQEARPLHPQLWPSFTGAAAVHGAAFPGCKALPTGTQRKRWENGVSAVAARWQLLATQLDWSSASHGGNFTCLDPSRTPWPFLLQLLS